MSFLGNLDGPKESEIVEKLGPDYFGITWEELDTDILYYRDSEARKEVIPVRIDNSGEPYLLLSSSDKKGQPFYFQGEGYRLNGRVLCINEKGEKYYLEL
jgi:hypothetical protein